MNIPTSRKELLAALAYGAASLRREILEFFSKKPKPAPEKRGFNETGNAVVVDTVVVKDDSIIDVTNEAYSIPRQAEPRTQPVSNLKNSQMSVPHWDHQYVYSYSEIHDANKKQKEFYAYLRNRFLNEEFVDIEGNSNYSFILLFDLIKTYENHKNIIVLEKQLRLLGEFYPKTNSYGLHFLAQIMEAQGDAEGAERIRFEHSLAYYDYWKLGSKYKKKLSLTDEEIKKLNRLSYSSNNFSDIEFCCIEIIKIYLSAVAEMERLFHTEQSGLDEQILTLSDVVARKHFRYRTGSQNYKYCLETTPDEIHTIIFKHCENAVREFYGHKRKINVASFYTHTEVQTEFETRIVEKLNDILSRLILKTAPPDDETETQLNSQNTTRWKIKFAELTSDYDGDEKKFVESILTLGKLNAKNPSVENIFYEASKFISKTDRVSSLVLYLHYLRHDLDSAAFDNKQLTKTIQKSLFKTNEQLHDFQIIVSEFLSDKDLEKAVQRIPAIYTLKRKKIQLDSSVIKEVQEQHSGTVELLNEYLQDEYEGETNTVKAREISADEVSIEITQKTESTPASIFTPDIAFTPVQMETLELFYKNSLTVSQSDLEDFAKSKRAFKSRLIDSLNEICYEILDDVLIEEDDEYCVISEDYYQKLLAK